MSRNMGRQAHRAVQVSMHRKLDDDIADTKSLLNTSVQATKDLKAHLKGLTGKKKEAAASGKAHRSSQVDANKFNIPIPKIQGHGAATTRMASSHGSESTPLATIDSESCNKDWDSDIEMQEITSVNVEMEEIAYVQGSSTTVTVETIFTATSDDKDTNHNSNGPLVSYIPTHELPMFQPPATAASAPTQAGETVTNNDSEEAGLMYHTSPSHWHPEFELPPFDLELFNAALEIEPIPEPSAAEIAAHLFLRRSLQNY
jgi:hypothetical protein